jgi:hypothetical protein
MFRVFRGFRGNLDDVRLPTEPDAVEPELLADPGGTDCSPRFPFDEPMHSDDRKDRPEIDRLTASERANLVSHIDVDALERLLHYVAPEERGHLLHAFTRPPPNQSFQMIAVIGGDPERNAAMNALLAEIWAPMWEAMGREAIESDEDYKLPGREIARERLGLNKKPTAAQE